MSFDYEQHRNRSAARQAEQSAEGRDIGTIPPVVDPDRRERGRLDLQTFLETYFPNAFRSDWSPDHVKVIKLIESAVLNGGLQAVAMPRGSGKSTICARAILWALFYGHHRYAMLICADDPKAKKILKSLQTEAEKNQALLEDFPEICYPIRKLERIAQRAKGQTCQGTPTDMVWKGSQLVLPTVPGSAAGGSVLEVGGITSAVRGGQYTKSDGTVIRPSIVLIDDPQTRESAGSTLQCQIREQTVSADLLGMAGPGESISALMTCTVVYPNDMADQMLKRELHPEWHGIRTKMLYAFPSDMKLWEQYWEIRVAEMIDDRGHAESNAFYERNREAMDEGAEVAWESRKRDDELSALQHAMNLYFRDPDAFLSEYQNEPAEEEQASEDYWKAPDIARKISGYERRHVPNAAQELTAFIDVQQRLLYWLVVAWSDEMTGWVVDYGTRPEQTRKVFKAQAVTNTLEKRYKAKLEVALRAGLTELVALLNAREFARDDGSAARLSRVGIDASWGQTTHVVKDYVRTSPLGGILLPCHGKGITATTAPISTYRKEKGEWRGLEARIAPAKGREVRHLLYDTNWWKSQAMRRLSTPIGAAGCVSLYGTGQTRHDFLADHFTAEKAADVTNEKTGRKVTLWTLPPGVTENHWFDCFTGCGILANTLGILPPGFEKTGRTTSEKPAKPRKKRKVKYL